MFNFLHKRTTFQWLILSILACFITFKLITQPIILPPQGAPFLYYNIYNILSSNTTLFVVVIGLILILQAVLLQIYFLRNRFLAKFSLFPAIFYFALLCCNSFLLPITPAFFLNLIIIIVLNLLHDYVAQLGRTRVFLAGIFTGIGMCIDFTSAILMIFIIASLTMNLFSKIKDIFISIVGLITSFIYIIAYYFLTDKLPVIFENLHEITFLNFFNGMPSLSPLNAITFFAFIFILFYVIAKTVVLYKSKLIVLRKNVLTLNVLLGILFLAIFFTILHYPSIFQYLFLPIAVYLTIFTQEKRRFFHNEIIFIILIVVLCL